MDPVFEEHRGLLQRIAQRITGSTQDAEDVVQEAWLAWSRVEQGRVREPRAYLVRTVTNAALRQRIRTGRRREQATGVHLPDPIIGGTQGSPEDFAIARDELSYALMTVVETLSPLERVVFVLHEGFGYPLGEIATMLDRQPAAIRQLAHRARRHVRTGRPRFSTAEVDRRELVERFVDGVEGRDLDGLLDLLAPEVALWTDGGGLVSSAPHGVHGRERLVRLIEGLYRTGRMPSFARQSITMDGSAAVELRCDGFRVLLTAEPDRSGNALETIWAVVRPD